MPSELHEIASTMHCPRCGAKPSDPCTFTLEGLFGAPMKVFHGARYDMAKQAEPARLETRKFVEQTLTGPRVHELTYDRWLAQVSKCCENISGLGIEDIPDFDYKIAWQNGELPYKIAMEALSNADFPFEDEDEQPTSLRIVNVHQQDNFYGKES